MKWDSLKTSMHSTQTKVTNRMHDTWNKKHLWLSIKMDEMQVVNGRRRDVWQKTQGAMWRVIQRADR